MATLGALAELVDGQLLGDAQRRVDGVADLGSAGPTDITFLTSPRYALRLAGTRAAAVLVAEAQAGAPCDQVICADPYLALAHVSQALAGACAPPPGIAAGAHVDAAAHVHPSASVAPGAVVAAGAHVGADCEVGAGCFVGEDAQLGAGCLLHPGARVLARCVLGARCILHAGAVIGSDGFGFAVDRRTGRRHKIPQLGTCILGDDVEIGANTTVDRATFGATRIGTGTKIDNLVQVAHNVELGRDCVVVSQTGIAGSSRCGDRVVFGAQGGVVGHIEIVSDVTLGARAGVAQSIVTPGTYSGAPVQPHRSWLRMVMAQSSLPEMRRRLRAVEEQLAAAAAPSSLAP